MANVKIQITRRSFGSRADLVRFFFAEADVEFFEYFLRPIAEMLFQQTAPVYHREIDG